MDNNLSKKDLEDSIEIKIKQVLKDEIYNNETLDLMADKLVKILSQLPNEPVKNKYLIKLLKEVKTKINKHNY